MDGGDVGSVFVTDRLQAFCIQRTPTDQRRIAGAGTDAIRIQATIIAVYTANI